MVGGSASLLSSAPPGSYAPVEEEGEGEGGFQEFEGAVHETV